MKKQIIVQVFPILFLCILSSSCSNAQSSPAAGDLYRQVLALDSILFTAFNTCDIEKFKAMFTNDLEFYHDTGGLTGFAHTMNFMSTTCEKKTGLKRTLVPGSVEVYPIKDYGAIQIGAHRFCHPENGKEDCGTFRFVHLWRLTDGEWKISRVVSYDH